VYQLIKAVRSFWLNRLFYFPCIDSCVYRFLHLQWCR